jgi:TatD DNase family protein
MTYKYFDIHSHLNFPQFNTDRDAIIETMRTQRIGTITVGTSFTTSQEAVALANAHEHLFATIGIHPTDAVESFDATAFESLVTPKVLAVGECGLDYYHVTDARQRARQRELFEQHIMFAKAHALPLMIHARSSKGSMDAYEETLNILENHRGMKANFHFFAGNLSIAKKAIDAGYTLSFDGPITFVSEYDDVIRYVPDSMIMAETDAPFAAPLPFRGKRSDPTMVSHIADRIADIRGVPRPAMAAQLVENALQSFGIPAVSGS